jgi:hypothetical protein
VKTYLKGVPVHCEARLFGVQPSLVQDFCTVDVAHACTAGGQYKQYKGSGGVSLIAAIKLNAVQTLLDMDPHTNTVNDTSTHFRAAGGEAA